MKVIKNNYENKEKEKMVENYPKLLICETCGSELEYNKEDFRIGEFGCIFVDCPCCNHDNLIEGEEFVLTKDNIDFPVHFHHCCEENGAVNCCTNEEIHGYIDKAINYFRENKDEFAWTAEIGNLHMTVFRYDGDESYYVIVTNDYYSTYIPFEDKDY